MVNLCHSNEKFSQVISLTSSSSVADHVLGLISPFHCPVTLQAADKCSFTGWGVNTGFNIHAFFPTFPVRLMHLKSSWSKSIFTCHYANFCIY